jgi:hypothetical protein
MAAGTAGVAHPSRLAARGGEHLRMTAVFVAATFHFESIRL